MRRTGREKSAGHRVRNIDRNAHSHRVCQRPTVAGASANPGTTTPAARPVPSINTIVQTFVTALDDLGIKHADPVFAEVGLYGAKAIFDVTVNGYDAGINVFPNAKTFTTCGEATDSSGGIYVAHGHASSP